MAREKLTFHSVPGTDYSVYDMTGKKVLAGLAETIKQTLDVSALAAGVYLLSATGKDLVPQTVKFTKQ